MDENAKKARKVTPAQKKAKPDLESNRVRPSASRSTADSARAKASRGGSTGSAGSSRGRGGSADSSAASKKQAVSRSTSPYSAGGSRKRSQSKAETVKESVEEITVPARRITPSQGHSYRKVPIPGVGHRNEVDPEEKRLNMLFLVIVAVLLVLFTACALIWRFSSHEEQSEESVIVQSASSESSADSFILTIESGMSATQVARALEGVTDTAAFLEYLESGNLASSLRTGTYSIPYGISAEALATALTSRSSSFLIYAGETIEEIDRALANRGLASAGDFRAACERVSEERGLSFAEGWFLSGSYDSRGAYELASAMNDAILALFRREASAVAESGMSLDDIVILSSMINRETQDEEQMRVIARILLNRLEIDMPLGVDATTRYETGNWTGEIRQSTFEELTPYNTRRKTGLPPSGIGAPSEAAVLAVLYPAESDDLYYLHDEEGKLYTSPDYDTHLETYRQVH